MTDGFRTDSMQSEVAGNQYGGAMTGNSLHEAGFAFDINWSQLTADEQQQILDIALDNGFEWGGMFSNPSDPVHFYVDPFGSLLDRQAYIPQAQQQFQVLRGQNE